MDRMNTRTRFYDLEQSFKELIEKNAKQYEIVRARIEGRTLRDIGSKEGFSREGIRLLEKKFCSKFRKILTNHSAFKLMESLGQKQEKSNIYLVTGEQLTKYMTEYGELFVLCLQYCCSRKLECYNLSGVFVFNLYGVERKSIS